MDDGSCRVETWMFLAARPCEVPFSLLLSFGHAKES